MVPVLDKNKQPLMPCSEKRAKLLMARGQAVSYYRKGFFCIKLLKDPSDRKYQEVVLGIDPGSKREGYTVATKNNVVLNITSDTPYWVKDRIETRRNLRRSRRYRKTPYRKCRWNRSSLRKNRIAPSTKARWDAKLRILKVLLRILPITIVNVEDICAQSKQGKKKWNLSFSPLETGKKYFYSKIEKLDLKLIKTQGFNTKEYRDLRGFSKSKNKLDYKWEAHNVDSHCLVEMVLNKNINPCKNFYQVNFLQFHRRQLHVQNPIKNNIRKQYGSTVSLGLARGSVIFYKKSLYYLGGSSKNKIAIYSIVTGNRVKRFCDKEDITVLYKSSFRINIISN